MQQLLKGKNNRKGLGILMCPFFDVIRAIWGGGGGVTFKFGTICVGI